MSELVDERVVDDDTAYHRSAHENAAQLFLSPLTVKTHAVRAMNKVSARDRAQLVSFAVRAGFTS